MTDDTITTATATYSIGVATHSMSLVGIYSDLWWLHKFCIKRLPTGERAVHKKDHYFHNKQCASCWHSVEDDDHIFTTCTKRKSQRKNIIKQIYVLRTTFNIQLCDILQEGLMTYFKGECMTSKMLQIRGEGGMGQYGHLIKNQLVIIGWDNILRGKFSKQWKIQQKAYTTRKWLKNPAEYAILSINNCIIP